jgi:hypothetical protein
MISVNLPYYPRFNFCSNFLSQWSEIKGADAYERRGCRLDLRPVAVRAHSQLFLFSKFCFFLIIFFVDPENAILTAESALLRHEDSAPPYADPRKHSGHNASENLHTHNLSSSFYSEARTWYMDEDERGNLQPVAMYGEGAGWDHLDLRSREKQRYNTST